MKKHLISFIVICTIWPSVSGAENTTLTTKQWAHTINVAGRQRMLIQKIAKEALLIVHAVDLKASRAHLKNSIHIFDARLHDLLEGNRTLGLVKMSDDGIRAQLKTVKKQWKPYQAAASRILIEVPIAEDDVNYAIEYSNELVLHMNKAVRLMEKQAANERKELGSLAVTVNLAGKLRMLSQRMTKEFLLVAHDFRKELSAQQLINTIKVFDEILNGLNTGDSALLLEPPQTKKIQHKLATILQTWQQFQHSLAPAQRDDLPIPEQIKQMNDLSDKILKQLEGLVKMYQAEAGLVHPE